MYVNLPHPYCYNGELGPRYGNRNSGITGIKLWNCLRELKKPCVKMITLNNLIFHDYLYLNVKI